MRLSDLLQILLVSMSPVLEIRGAIPLAIAKGLPPLAAYVFCAVGNMLPIPPLILLARRVLRWLKNFPAIGRLAERLEQKAHRKSTLFQRGSFFGLLLLVAIPLPGTGAWTGALVASVLGLRLRSSLPAIFLGVLIAGMIVLCVTYGVRAVL